MVLDPNSDKRGDDSSRDAGVRISAARFVLVVRSVDGKEREFELMRAKTIIGRIQRCDLMVALPNVADQHCEIEVDDEGLVVTDLDTELGTHINGERVQKGRAGNGDAIGIGPMRFHVRDRHHYHRHHHPSRSEKEDDRTKDAVVEPRSESDSPEIVTMPPGSKSVQA